MTGEENAGEAGTRKRRTRFADPTPAPTEPPEAATPSGTALVTGGQSAGATEAPTPATAERPSGTEGAATPASGNGAPSAEGQKKRKRRKGWGEPTNNPINMPTILGTGALPNLPHIPGAFMAHVGPSSSGNDLVAAMLGAGSSAAVVPDFTGETHAMKQSRKVYVGNVPMHCTVNELMNWSSEQVLKACPTIMEVTKGAIPVINGMVAGDKGYAFIECACAEVATIAVNLLDGKTFRGSILRMRRPKDYIPGWEPDHVILTRLIPGYRIPISREVQCDSEVPPSPTRLYVGNLHPVVSEAELKDFFHKYAELRAFKLIKKHPDDELSMGYAFAQFEFPSDFPAGVLGLRGVQFMGKPIAVFPADLDPEILPKITDEVAQGRSGLDVLPESVPERPREEWYRPLEWVKPLSEAPTRILEISGCISESMEELNDEDACARIEEDVRAECERFGLTWSSHLTRLPGAAAGAAGEAAKAEGGAEGAAKTEGDAAGAGTEVKVEGELKAEGAGGAGEGENGMGAAGEAGAGVVKDEGGNLGTEPKGESKGVPADEGHIEEVREEEGAQGAAVKEEGNGDAGREGGDGDGDEDEDGDGEGGPKKLYGLGKVYVEFARKETAMVALFRLFGRSYDGRLLTARYFPVKTYQRQFNKGILPTTLAQKIQLAIAVQARITEALYHDDEPGRARVPLVPPNRRTFFWDTAGGRVTDQDAVRTAIEFSRQQQLLPAPPGRR